ncbi:MAG UNVERIFIED_CONTAM: hypothetical protein LVR18_04215 [Planctomycetaceae bacterium]|jgi:hypothetical protein
MTEEPAAEEPAAEEPAAGEEGSSNQEPISLQTPDKDDVLASKQHLLDRTVKPAQENAEEPAGGNEEPATEEPPVAEEPAAEEPAVEEPVTEEPAAEEPAAEEPAAEEPAVEEPVVEEPAAEEPVASVGSDKAHLLGRKVKSAPTADVAAPADAAEEPAVEEPAAEEPAVEEPAAEEPVASVGSDKAHLLGRKVKSAPTADVAAPADAAEEPAVEEPAAEEPAVEEPAAEEPVASVGSNKAHLLGRKVKSAPTADAAAPAAEALRVMEGADPAGIDVPAVSEELVTGVDSVIVEATIEETFVVDPVVEAVDGELVKDPVVALPIEWFCVLPTPFSMGVLGFPVDENGHPILRGVTPGDAAIAEPVVADGELVTVTDVPAVNPKGILQGRTVKPTPAPADPTQPSPKAILLQRNTKPAPATEQ